ncbi:MAG: thioredoxin domain-containing protein [Gemmatimonadetes bacterium]|nr:thioredoxin domain-containing protein [Gemmatimonadota bacterium]
MAQKDRAAHKAAGKSMTRFYIILGAVGVIGIGTLAYTLGSSAMSGVVTEPVDLAGIEDMNTLVSMAAGVGQGDPQAPVRILEFSDYQCPWCAKFAFDVKPFLSLNYIETGKVHYVYYDFPLFMGHAHAFLAARAARCAGEQSKYWEYHDELFRQQARWSIATNPTGDFVDYAGSVGVDTGAFEACLKSDRFADVVTANLRLGEQLGVQGPPT